MKLKILLYIAITACTPAAVSSCAGAEGYADNRTHQIDLSEGTVLGIPLDLQFGDLSNLEFEVDRRQVLLEGDEYDSALIKISSGIEFQAIFDEHSRLYSLETVSELVADIHGLGIGSRLEDLVEYWPNGSFVYGEAHGRFARYITGTQIVFSFNPSGINQSCFETRQECNDTEDLIVEKIVIYTVPVPIP